MVVNANKSSVHCHKPHSIPGDGHETMGKITSQFHRNRTMGKTILVPIDTHSKWIEAIHSTPPTISAAIINGIQAKICLQRPLSPTTVLHLLRRYSSFFLKDNEVNHIAPRIIPHHTSASTDDYIRRGLKNVTSGNISVRIAQVLFTYHNYNST